jgi:hypothetical protein
MNLTGKCKEEFEKWRMKQNYDVDAPFFYELNYSMQYGVYVDFFDSVGIIIDISPSNFCSVFYVYLNKKTVPVTTCGTREDARTASIKKANEIYNN